MERLGHSTDLTAPSAAALEGLSPETLEELAEAGQELVEIHRLLAKTGNNVVGELLKAHETFYEWDHYPPGDVYDHDTHSQFYYHAHAAAERFPGENGHFHTFIRPKGMPDDIRPARVPGFKMPDNPDDALSHLIAISMTKEGLPFRLFTVNRWVTGEVWYGGADVKRLVRLFDIDHTQPSWPVNRWANAMLRFFRPQIDKLVDARDETVARWRESHADQDVFEDRELEVTSHWDISIDDQMQAVLARLEARESA